MQLTLVISLCLLGAISVPIGVFSFLFLRLYLEDLSEQQQKISYKNTSTNSFSIGDYWSEDSSFDDFVDYSSHSCDCDDDND